MDNHRLTKDLVFLILKFLDEEGFKESAHKLESESGLYFDIKYFEDIVLAGKWDDAESYISRFTKIDDNSHSTKIYFEIRKQKFFEALDIEDRTKALDILIKDLVAFSPAHGEQVNQLTELLKLNNIRDHPLLSRYGDVISERKIVLDVIKNVVEANPVFRGKLNFPAFNSQRIRYLLHQSFSWQHLHCKDPVPNLVIETLFVDHVCKPCLNTSSLQSEESSSTEMFESYEHKKKQEIKEFHL